VKYLTYEYVLELHDELIEEYGGAKGILNEGLLHSALETPKARFNSKDLYRTVFDKTAAYLFHIIKNHAFVDGNKRTGSMAALVFFTSNYEGSFGFIDDDYQELILNIANGKAGKKEIVKFFKSIRIKD